MFQITLNQESAAVLLRCLAYGRSALSAQEESNGIAEIIRKNVSSIQHEVSTRLADHIIIKMSEKNRENC